MNLKCQSQYKANELDRDVVQWSGRGVSATGSISVWCNFSDKYCVSEIAYK